MYHRFLAGLSFFCSVQGVRCHQRDSQTLSQYIHAALGRVLWLQIMHALPGSARHARVMGAALERSRDAVAGVVGSHAMRLVWQKLARWCRCNILTLSSVWNQRTLSPGETLRSRSQPMRRRIWCCQCAKAFEGGGLVYRLGGAVFKDEGGGRAHRQGCDR